MSTPARPRPGAVLEALRSFLAERNFYGRDLMAEILVGLRGVDALPTYDASTLLILRFVWVIGVVACFIGGGVPIRNAPGA